MNNLLKITLSVSVNVETGLMFNSVNSEINKETQELNTNLTQRR